jgi:hypothetical protein
LPGDVPLSLQCGDWPGLDGDVRGSQRVIATSLCPNPPPPHASRPARPGSSS